MENGVSVCQAYAGESDDDSRVMSPEEEKVENPEERGRSNVSSEFGAEV